MRRTPNYRFERSEREKKKHRKKLEKLKIQAERTARRQGITDPAEPTAAPAEPAPSSTPGSNGQAPTPGSNDR
jgi:hypothetical protein